MHHQDQSNNIEEEKAAKTLDYKSPESPYGLIHKVLGNTNRQSRKFKGGWKSDVWLEDGNLVVLKGGILNQPKKRPQRVFSSIWSRSDGDNDRILFQPSRRIISRHEEVRRHDRNTLVASNHDPVRNRIVIDNDRTTALHDDGQFWNVNFQCFIC